MMDIIYYVAWGLVTIIVTTYMYFVFHKILIVAKLYFLYFKINKNENPQFKELAKEIKEYADSISIFTPNTKENEN